jgi:hypothetical protein
MLTGISVIWPTGRKALRRIVLDAWGLMVKQGMVPGGAGTPDSVGAQMDCDGFNGFGGWFAPGSLLGGVAKKLTGTVVSSE